MPRIRLALIHLPLAAILIATSGWTAPAASSIPDVLTVDVLVVGGTPGGAAAAIAAARAGARVLLTEAGSELGGVLSGAWLTTFDMSRRPDGQHLIRGVFLEQYSRLGVSFDRDAAARVLGQAVVHEPGLRTIVDAALERVLMDGDRIAAVEFIDQRWRRIITVRAAQVIDATDDGDVAAAAGAPYTVGHPGYRDGDRWMQAATLIFRLGGVDWRNLVVDILARLEQGADPFGWGVNGPAAWGYPEHAARYAPAHPHVLLYPLNLARQRDGSVLINALNVTSVNGLDRESVEIGTQAAVAELPGLVEYLRTEIAGFNDAHLLDYAPALYIRETRHVEGLYTLTAQDILAGSVFDDRIAMASYPIDIHPYFPGWTNPHPRRAIPYSIPYRAIVPQRIQNLLMASRALSATSEAHGSVRVVPTIMAVGQAAGVAAALAVQLNVSPREIADSGPLTATLQGALITQGAYLGGSR